MATAKKPAASAAKTTKPKAAPAKAAKPKTAANAAKTSVTKAKPSTGKVEKEVKASMKDEFTSFKEKAADGARTAADRGKERAADALGGIGKILRESADTIDERVGTQYGEYARKAADAVDGFAGKVDAKDVDDIVEDARQFVRKSPAVAIGAAAAIGFILARVIRSGRDA